MRGPRGDVRGEGGDHVGGFSGMSEGAKGVVTVDVVLIGRGDHGGLSWVPWPNLFYLIFLPIDRLTIASFLASLLLLFCCYNILQLC